MPDKWIAVNYMEAKRHPLYGLRGWPILLMLSVFFGIARDAQAARAAFDPTGLEASLAAWVGVEAWAAWMYIVARGMLLLLLLAKHAWFARAFVAAFVIAISWLAVDVAVVANITALSVPQVLEATFPRWPQYVGTVGGFGISVLWCFYVLRSRRINVTTRHRVRPEDLKLVQYATAEED